MEPGIEWCLEIRVNAGWSAIYVWTPPSLRIISIKKSGERGPIRCGDCWGLTSLCPHVVEGAKELSLPATIIVKATIFPGAMYGCESWTINKAEHRRTDTFQLWCWRRLESPLDCKEIQPLHPKGDQSSMFIGKTDVEAETPILWPSDVKAWLIWKDPSAGKDWRWEEKGTTEDEMVGWHHWFDGHEFE